MAILIDASVFCAYANLRDVHHEKARKIIRDTASGKYGSGVTTDYIFDETVTVALRKAGKKTAMEIGKYLLDSEIFLTKIDAAIFEKAWNLFEKSDNLSFTDCTSLAFIDSFGIKRLATFDNDFREAENVEVVDG